MHLILLKEIPEDPKLQQQWNDLVARVAQPQVFYTYEWALAVQRAYPATLHTLLFLAYDEQECLCGIAALAADADGRHISFLTATTGDYCDFLSLPEHKPAFVAAVLAELKKGDGREITLTNLPADSTTVTALRTSAQQSGYRCFARTAYVCAQISLAKLERRPSDHRLVLPRGKMVRRFMSAMGRESPVCLDHARSWDDVAPILPQFVHAHVARFLATGRISNLARPERRIFLAELAKLLSQAGWLALTRLTSGKDAFAWNYGFQFQGTWFWYQPTFDSDLEKYSPGFCCLTKLIEEAANNPAFGTVDLGLGAEEYKDRLSNQTRETLYITLKTSAAQHYREIFRYYAAQTVQTSPRAEATVRAIVLRWHRLKERIRSQGAGPTLGWAVRRVREPLWSESEVFFYEWAGSSVSSSSTLTVQRLDLNALASATCQYVDDKETLTYLLRAASRLKQGKAEGFGLVNAAGKFLHFAWATPFDGFFLSELRAKVEAPAADCIMLFDCWTPAAAQGHGYYAQTVEFIAKLVREKGQRPWIFSAASNVASVRGLQKTGFQRRYSLFRLRLLGWQWIKSKTPTFRRPTGAGGSAGSENSAA